MPDYTIIAGPNGAGKSSFCKLLSSPGSLIYDADKVKALKEKEYPDIPDESIEIMLTVEYWEAEKLAVTKNQSLTVESNLRNDFLINRLEYFKEKGYKLNLIFMLLPDIITSADRVNLRVRKKGHFVDLESIKYNYEHSLKNLKLHFNKFDTVMLLDSSLRGDTTIPEVLLTINNNAISYFNQNPSSWAKPTIDELLQNLASN